MRLVGAAHFGSRFVSREHSVGGDFVDKAVRVVNPAVQAMAAQHADFDLDHAIDVIECGRTFGAKVRVCGDAATDASPTRQVRSPCRRAGPRAAAFEIRTPGM
jgi:hypothetical protein